jgi:hypothetical protein
MLSAIARKFGPRPNQADKRPVTVIIGRERGLLPVASQHLIAGSADLGTILLKAGQNAEIALINHCTTVALNIAGAGLLLFRRAAVLGDGAGGNGYRQQGDGEKKLVHRVPSF